MIISFGWTSQYLPPLGSKDTTRRIWKPRTLKSWQKAWDEGRLVHDAVNKCMAYGGYKIGKVTLIESPTVQKLSAMPDEDVVREGDMVETVEEYIGKYFKGNAAQEVVVVRFTFEPNEKYWEVMREMGVKA
ncbi:MAG: hypothetical protein AAGD25_06335 [Cyanobacteria bacterium P01_F01_bin.150]